MAAAAFYAMDAVSAMTIKLEPDSDTVLTHSTSSSRQAALSVPAQPYYYPFTTEAIFSHTNNINDNHRHDVPPVNAPALLDTSLTHFVNTSQLESHPLPSPSRHHHDSINAQPTRLRTSQHPVQRNPSLLAAHHGIPVFLPPPPVPKQSSSLPHSTIVDPLTHILSLNYQAMLSSTSTNEPVMDHTLLERALADENAMQEMQRLFGESRSLCALHDSILTLLDSRHAASSPEFTPEMAFDTTPGLDFLTSPMSGEQGVMEELQTPFNGPDDLATLLGPSFEYPGAQLFGGCEPDESYAHIEKAAPMLPPSFSPHGGNLYTMPAHSPYINPSDLISPPTMPIYDVTPPVNGATAAASTTSRLLSSSASRKRGPTGTRKNLTPASLIPEDAPIQSRHYVTPSATSRKAVPQNFARKRSRAMAFADDDDEDEDELDDGPEPKNAEEAAIAAKRRQNTLAARRSRKRKLQYQNELEVALEGAKAETDKWKGRAEAMKAVLYSNNIQVPPWSD